ncbi:MAG: hypothetical protein JO247_08100 [Chloroflexi bacterium]|nr:hypothetical protein [Chloroflexota bacterium]
MSTTAEAVEYCIHHPSVETVVHCSRCEAPICPRCMIETPVGMRCRDCARLRRPPMYDVSGKYLWRAIGLAALFVTVGGLVFKVLAGFGGGRIYFQAMLYLLTGLGVAEALSWVANRKRGRRLQIISVITVLLMTQAGPLVTGALTGRLVFTGLGLITAAIAAAVAWTRLR